MTITVINKYKPVAQSALTHRIYVGRPTALGNPYKSMSDTDRANTVEKFEQWLRFRMRTTNQTSTEMLRLLSILKADRHLQLECSCAPKACHADVIKKVLEEMLIEENANAV